MIAESMPAIRIGTPAVFNEAATAKDRHANIVGGWLSLVAGHIR